MRGTENRNSYFSDNGMSHLAAANKKRMTAILILVLLLVATIILWAIMPTYKVLFSTLGDQEANTVLNVLHSTGFNARLDASTGAILVPVRDVHRARIKLASHGLPNSILESSGLKSKYNNESINIYVDDVNGEKINVQNKLEFLQRAEEKLTQRVERILSPIVGAGSVRAQVTIHPDSNDKQKREAIVIVDESREVIADGDIVRTKRSQKEIKNLTNLVKKAIGFNKNRGDSVEIINARFNRNEITDSSSTISGWNQVWFEDEIIVILIVLLIVSIIIVSLGMNTVRPIYSSVSGTDTNTNKSDRTRQELNSDVDSIDDFEKNIRTASMAAQHDPKLVAQIIRNWVEADGNT